MKTSSNQKRNRAHNARPVHAQARQTVIRSALGKPPKTQLQTKRLAFASAESDTNRYPLSANRSICDLLIAAFLWAFAILFTFSAIAILIRYANTLFGVE